MKYLQIAVQSLQQLLQKIHRLQIKCLGQILALEKITNKTLKTNIIINKKQDKQITTSHKEQIKIISVQQKIAAVLNQIQMKQKIILNQDKNTKIKPIDKVIQIPIQKKPPIPTVNRVGNSNNRHTPAYLPPKNKNQVTGKVTQSIKSTNTQIFKPQISHDMKKQSKLSRQKYNNTRSSLKRQSSSMSKQVKNQQKSTIKKQQQIPLKKQPQIIKQQIIVIKKQQQKPKILEGLEKNKIKKQLKKQKLVTFNKQIQQILQQSLEKQQKNHRFQLQKMIKQYEGQFLKNKKSETTQRYSFIKHCHDLAISRSRFKQNSNFTITRKKWKYYENIEDLDSYVNGLLKQINNLNNIKQYRINPRQQYRIIKTFQLLKQQIENIQNIQSLVPSQIDLNFKYKKIQNIENISQKNIMQQINQTVFSQALLKYFNQIKQSSQLQKSQLRGLQVLMQIGIFKNKRSPLLIMSNQYNNWKNYYFQGK